MSAEARAAWSTRTSLPYATVRLTPISAASHDRRVPHSPTRSLALLAACALATLLAAPTAHAARSGALLFARDGALWRQELAARSVPTRLASLPAGAALQRLDASADGALLVLHFDHEPFVAWLVAGEPALRTGPCRSHARLAPTAGCVLCGGETNDLIVHVADGASYALPPRLRLSSFLGPSPPELAALLGTDVVAFRRHGRARRVLARLGQVPSQLMVAPDGMRAAAVLGEGTASRVVGVELDGGGVPRVLGGPGAPVGWSADSTWVLIRMGAVPPGLEGAPDGGDDDSDGEPDTEPADGSGESGAVDDSPSPFLLAEPTSLAARRKKAKRKAPPPAPLAVRACVVRSVGGQSKCWNHYAPLAFSPDGTEVLLLRDGALYAGTIDGVRPLPPKLLLDRVDGAASWTK